MQSGYWPNTQLVAEKCYLLVQDESENKDVTKYLAGNSPTRTGDSKKSTIARKRSRSPGKMNDASNGFGASMKQSPARHESGKFSKETPGTIS